MLNPFRTKGQVEEYNDLKHKSPREIRELTVISAEKVREAEYAKFADVDIEGYWRSAVEPILLRAAKRGEYDAYILHLSEKFAKRLACYGRRLGFETKSDHDSTLVKWRK